MIECLEVNDVAWVSVIEPIDGGAKGPVGKFGVGVMFCESNGIGIFGCAGVVALKPNG